MDTKALKGRLDGKIQASKSKSSEERVISIPNSTSLVPVDSEYSALTNNALEIISDNLKHQPLSHALFDIIKSPSGGATAFIVPGISGEEVEKELTGIILDYTTPRAYWDTPDPVEGTPPLCYSHNSMVSYPDGKVCAHCVYNDFGSKDGDSHAKACKEYVEIFLLRPDNILPIIVRIPVSSKVIFQRYMTRLIGRMLPLSSVVTKITLEKVTSKAGQPYAQYIFEAVKELSPNESISAKSFGQKFMEILTADNEPLERSAG